MAISIKWVPYHSWFKLNLDDTIIQIDPSFFKSWEGAKKETTEKADIILITHAHHDHCEPELIAKLSGKGTLVIAAECCREKLQANAEYIRPGDEKLIGNILIKAVHAYNIGKTFHPKGFGVGYLINYDGKTIYHAGDTDFIPEMSENGQIDLAMLPVGGTYTMTLEESVNAATLINPAVLMPMHLLDNDPENFRVSVEKGNKTKLIILKQSEEFSL